MLFAQSIEERTSFIYFYLNLQKKDQKVKKLIACYNAMTKSSQKIEKMAKKGRNIIFATLAKIGKVAKVVPRLDGVKRRKQKS